MINRGSRSIESQGPPISPSQGIGSQYQTTRPPPHRHRGGIPDDHIPYILRARYYPHRHIHTSFTSGRHIVRDIAQDERSQALQIGVSGRGGERTGRTTGNHCGPGFGDRQGPP